MKTPNRTDRPVTRTGKRTAHVGIQIVEEAPNRIAVFFDHPELQPIVFREAVTLPAHWDRLQRSLQLAAEATDQPV